MKHQLVGACTIMLLLVFTIQSCMSVPSSPMPTDTVQIIEPTHTKSITATVEVKPSQMMSTFPIAGTTSVPPGVFALQFYSPLIMTYDFTKWEDKSKYSDNDISMNVLQAKGFETCYLGVTGPSGFFPQPDKIVQLGSIIYQVTKIELKSGKIGIYYIEDESLKGYDYQLGLPVLLVQTDPYEQDKCITLAEEVLSTLRPSR